MNRYSSYQRNWPRANNNTLKNLILCSSSFFSIINNNDKDKSLSLSQPRWVGAGDQVEERNSLQFEDVGELRTRTQAVQKAPVNLQREVLQFDAVALLNVEKTLTLTASSSPAAASSS